ncbi:talin rod domain-containing protein 1-like [Haliotis cracherodii]|uniref:talin rod domain-containing protein 1-like n=1 Tax=Haliotis cracherodii TaxID=6455 RepID=UPI0039EBAF82
MHMDMLTLCSNLLVDIGGGRVLTGDQLIPQNPMHQMVMPTDSARGVAMTCDRCHSKMQSIAELLLISCDARPVSSEDLSPFTKSYSRCRDEILDILRRLSNLMKDVASQVSSVAAVHWHDISNCIQDMSDFVIRLVECCGHIAYLIAIDYPDCFPSQAGIIDRYKICRANLDIKISCTRLKRSRLHDLHSQFLVDICSNISQALSIMTDVCRTAGENASDSSDQEQFKLCVKSVTSSTSCLIASIKCFKSHPNSGHLGRIVAFCDPVMTASHALVTFTTEDGFIGKPAHLTADAKESQKSILGACMSIVSANVQTCRSVRDLAYDVMNARHRERIALCTESMDRASSQLQDIIMSYSIDDASSDTTSSTVSSTSSR